MKMENLTFFFLLTQRNEKRCDLRVILKKYFAARRKYSLNVIYDGWGEGGEDRCVEAGSVDRWGKRGEEGR